MCLVLKQNHCTLLAGYLVFCDKIQFNQLALWIHSFQVPCPERMLPPIQEDKLPFLYLKLLFSKRERAVGEQSRQGRGVTVRPTECLPLTKP